MATRKQLMAAIHGNLKAAEAAQARIDQRGHHHPECGDIYVHSTNRMAVVISQKETDQDLFLLVPLSRTIISGCIEVPNTGLYALVDDTEWTNRVMLDQSGAGWLEDDQPLGRVDYQRGIGQFLARWMTMQKRNGLKLATA